MKMLLTGLILLTSFSAFTQEENTSESFTVVMKHKAVIARYYPNDSYNTSSIKTQCDAIKGSLLKSTERVSESYGVTAIVGICKFPEIVASDAVEVQKEQGQRSIYQAVASLRFPSGNGTEGLRSKCESRGGVIIDSKYADTGKAFSTTVGGGVCKITIEE